MSNRHKKGRDVSGWICLDKPVGQTSTAAVAVLKRLFGARISLRAEQLTYLVGFVFLFAFIIWVSGFDIIRSLGGGTPSP